MKVLKQHTFELFMNQKEKRQILEKKFERRSCQRQQNCDVFWSELNAADRLGCLKRRTHTLRRDCRQ